MDVKVDFKLQNQKTSGAWRSLLAGHHGCTMALWPKLVLIALEREKGIP